VDLVRMARLDSLAGTILIRAKSRARFRLLSVLLIPLMLIIIGTVGYEAIEEEYTFFDALYMTVITLSTTGYGEVHPLSTTGRVFTIFLTLGGVFTLFYAASEIIRVIISGEMQDILGRQRMERNLASLQNHLIVCGFGRMGRLVCQEFSRNQMPFVIIDQKDELLAEFDMPFGIPLLGDATSDEVLKHAGIERARALVTVMSSDADNLYTTMSARLLNKNVFIVARVEEMQSEIKLRRAGANRVVSPYQIGGHRLAQAIIRPTVVDFIELASRHEHVELQLEETRITAKSPLAGIKLRDSKIRDELKVIIVTVKKASGHMVFNPDPDTLIEADDILIAIGPREQLDRLIGMANR
jgi:voltage-gated potassium channel